MWFSKNIKLQVGKKRKAEYCEYSHTLVDQKEQPEDLVGLVGYIQHAAEIKKMNTKNE